MTSSAPAPRATGRPPLWLIFGVTLTGILANSLLTPNITEILQDFGQPEGRAGLLVAATPLPGILMAPIIGVLADRYGRRNVLIPCLVVFGVSALLSALAPNFTLLLVARFLQGAGGAGLINLALVLIGDHWEGGERTTLIGRNSATLTVGLALFPSIGGVIGEFLGWRYALAIGGLALPVAAVGWSCVPDARPATARTVSDQLRGAVMAVRQPAVLTVLASGVLLFTVIFGVFLTTLPVHLDEEFGLSAGPQGLVLSTFALGASVAAFNLGLLRRRFSARSLLVFSCALIAISAAAIGVAPTVLLVIVASLAYGLGDGTVIPVLQDLIVRAAPTEQRASVMAAWVSGIRLGQTVGPIGASLLFSVTSTRTTMLVGAGLFAVIAAAMTVAPLDLDEEATVG